MDQRSQMMALQGLCVVCGHPLQKEQSIVGDGPIGYSRCRLHEIAPRLLSVLKELWAWQMGEVEDTREVDHIWERASQLIEGVS